MKSTVLIIILFATINSFSQIEIDSAFGNNGQIVTGFGISNNKATAVAVQQDGKIIVGGSSYSAKSKNFFEGDSDNVTLVKYTSNGTIDNTFGIEGKVITDYYDLFPNQNFNSYLFSLKLQTDGKIVIIVELKGLNSAADHFILSRYNNDGSLDTSFGVNGIVFIDYFDSFNNQNPLFIQPDGKIIISDIDLIYVNATTNYSDFVLHRYNTDGSVDNTFGTNGSTSTSLGNGLGYTNCVTLQSDGKIILVGGFFIGNTSRIAVVRYTTSGILDTSFDTDGKVLTSLGVGTSSIAYYVWMATDGKFFVAGNTGSNAIQDSVLFVTKYNNNGSLDTSFDTDGFATNNYSTNYLEQIRSIFTQPDGKIVTTHFVNYDDNVNFTDFVTRRFNSDATIDSSFGTNGKVTTTVVSGYNLANSAALQQDGKIIVVGYSYEIPNVKTEISAVRYDSNGDIDNSFSGDGIVLCGVESSNDDLSILLVQPDDKLIAVGVKKNFATNGAVYVDILLSRYNHNGGLDSTFGNQGKIISTYGQNINRILGAILQPDGKIVIANSFYTPLNFTPQIELIRYNNNGSIDTTFGTNGKLSISSFGGLISQDDGKIIVVHWYLDTQNNPIYTVNRYNNNGTIDTSFDTDGSVDLIGNLTILSNTIGKNIAIQNDGKIVLCFTSPNQNNSNGIKVIRLNTDGSIDSSFTSSIGDDTAYADAVFIRPDNKIIVTGSEGNYFKTMQYNPNGTIDNTYGTDGILSSTLDINYRIVKDVVLQPDGKLIVALTKYGDTLESYDFIVRRFNVDGTNDVDFGSNSEGQITTSFYNTYDEVASVVLQSDNKIVLAGTTTGLINRDFAITRFTNNVLKLDDVDFFKRTLIVYPNPTNSYLNIKFPSNFYIVTKSISIYDILGKEVYFSDKGMTTIDVSNFKSGIFIINVQTDHGNWNGKFIKK